MIFYYLDLLGVAVFAVSGVLAVSRRGLDLFGVLVVAALTAIGGGTLRDLLLDRHPIFWIADPSYLLVIAAATPGAVLYLRRRPQPGRLFLLADTLGLALFTLSGAQVAEALALPPVIIVVMAVMTGVAGGLMRDVLSGKIPLILSRDLYATAALAGASLYLLLQALALPRPWAFACGVVAVTGLRLIAILHGLRLPVFRLP